MTADRMLSFALAHGINAELHELGLILWTPTTDIAGNSWLDPILCRTTGEMLAALGY